MPEGCGEQKMRKISTTVLARRYLEETSQLKEENRKRFDNILNKSYQDMIALQNDDGSFDLWGTSHQYDVWKRGFYQRGHFLDLTAYIVKLTAQFDKIKPIPDKNALNKAMNYISRQQNSDGSFINRGNPQFRDMQKYSNIPDVSLTAFVLVVILENESLREDYPLIIEKGLNFIENKFYNILHDGTNYERALTLYLYALAEKDHQLMLNKLFYLAVQTENEVYWNLNQNPSSAATQVEISSYVALALVKLQKFEEVMKVAKFLMSKRNPRGGFESTTDTVLGLQALSEISQILYSKDTNINIVLRNQLNKVSNMTINQRKSRSITQSLPSNTRKIQISATGSGVASLQVSCQYKQKIKNFETFFDLTVRPTKEENFLYLEICVKTKNGQKSNMALLAIELPSGYAYQSGPNQDGKEIKVSWGVDQ